MWRKLLVILFILVSVTSVFAQSRFDDFPPDLPIPVSLINLIANPEQYHGRLVGVFGWAAFSFGQQALHFSVDRMRMATGPDAIWLEFSDEFSAKADLTKYNGEFVMVVGVFNKDRHGDMGLYPGTIVNIERMAITPPPEELLDPSRVISDPSPTPTPRERPCAQNNDVHDVPSSAQENNDVVPPR